MTTSEFTALLKNPAGLNSLSYESLDNLLLQFPYCNGIRMLLLKKYKNDKHIAFERHLALASMYASDRGKLYDFLHTTPSADPKIVDINKQSSEEKKTKVTTTLISPPPVFHFQVSENPPVLAFQKPITIEDLDEVNKHTDEEQEDDSDRGLSAMPIEEWLHDFEPPRLENKDKSALAKKSFKLSRIPLFEKGLFDFLEDNPEDVKETAVPKKKKSVSKKGKKKAASKKTDDLKEEIKKLNDLVSDDVEEAENLSVMEEIVDVDALDAEQLEQVFQEKEPSNDIFDLFLTQTDGFLKSLGDKKLMEPAVDEMEWEDDSIAENEEIVSETLAAILAKQGQKDKAIKMYESLSLTFPKKSRLFAQKIAELS